MDTNTSGSYGTTFFSFFKNKFEGLKETLGLAESKTSITFELSEFIQEVNSSLETLPIDYKELFEPSSIGPEFFVNRQEEIETLEICYGHWIQNHFVSCAIIGEKGCGATSLVTTFKEKCLKADPIRSELHWKIFTQEGYFEYFSTLFNTGPVTTNQELIDHLNNTPDEKVIILENLHHMFLKKIGGFQAVRLLFELISYTTKKVFWVGVFTPETWNYLDKTTSISTYFTNKITLEPLSNEHIAEIITKRNHHANLTIKFLPSQENKESKSYENLSKSQKQIFLKEKFFKQLHELSNGNITLSLFYWLRSIEKIGNNTIYIQEIEGLDYGFIRHLSPEDLFVLQAMIIHDGLALHDFCIVINEPIEECRKILMPMLEKGVLIQANQKYNINPVIYKHVQQHLSSKNYIH